MRVLIADDQALFRRGLRETLADAFSKVTFGEARTAQEVLASVRRYGWDVVILDIGILGKAGPQVLDDLKRLQPELPILLFGIHAEQFVPRALKTEVAGYLNKDCLPEELKEAINIIVGGGQYVNPTLTERLEGNLGMRGDLPLHELLSDREFQVLRMLASGRSLKAIAEELTLSVKTVSTYRARIIEKTGMQTNAELIRYALQTHLVE